MKTLCLATAATLFALGSLSAQFEFTSRSTVYFQDFSNLDVSNPSTAPAKDWVDDVTVSHWRGRVSDAPATSYRVTHGSNPSSGLQVWHAQDGTDRRALGSLTDVNNRNALLAFGMLNATGAVIDEVTIEFSQVQWYAGTGAANDKMAFSYQVNYDAHTGGSWTVFPDLDVSGFVNGGGVLPEVIFTEKGATLTGLNWQPGEQLWIRWVDLDVGGGDAGAGFDSIRISLPGGEGTSFAEWRSAGHFSPDELADEAISGPGADPGGYGIPNLLRYALGLDPRQPSRSNLPFATIDPETGEHEPVFTFSRIADISDVAFTLEISDNLQDWSKVAAEQIEIAPAEEGFETVTARIDPSPESDRLFFRLRANLAE